MIFHFFSNNPVVLKQCWCCVAY